MPGTNSTISSLGASAPASLGSPETIVNSLGPYPSDGAKKTVSEAAQTGKIPDYYRKTPGDCGGATVGTPGLSTQLGIATAQATAQAATGAIKVGTTALNAVPVVGSVISSVVSLITAPFQHHAQAVKTEQDTLCIAVPDANNFLALVDQYVTAGQWDHVTAVQQLEAGFTAWQREVSGILKDSGGKCNAACVYEKCFRAAIEKRKLDYQLIEASQATASKNLPGSVVSSLSAAGSSVSQFLKETTGAIQSGLNSGNYLPFLSALVLGGGVVLTFWYFHRLGRRRP